MVFAPLNFLSSPRVSSDTKEASLESSAEAVPSPAISEPHQALWDTFSTLRAWQLQPCPSAVLTAREEGHQILQMLVALQFGQQVPRGQGEGLDCKLSPMLL